ncbi:hypothetical protein GPDM_09275 [Planococcus donghaensis MPA1U2]|uniref:Cxxc_20_cxxc protein n=1 Tax=Planococcus donghaensis MPA1U2 TaxID=933115 RepID=E7RHN2_9BACL|nr:TIGR04104 family putative zinc finger protein [Planococcus donghaensis]EGA89476.1 hypothetical protein GPDM_09275 [Planococcus donghaensis MPA1U2]
MQTCEVCRTPFTWKQVTKSLLAAYKPISCRTCGNRYKVQFLSRVLASLLVFGPIFMAILFSRPISTQMLIFVAFIVLPSVFVALPYLIRYRIA